MWLNSVYHENVDNTMYLNKGSAGNVNTYFLLNYVPFWTNLAYAVIVLNDC